MSSSSNSDPPQGVFHRKPLPEGSVDLCSGEGQRRWLEATAMGSAPAAGKYFLSLMCQFRTQDEPAYCGVSTLVMTLNALSVDPGIAWKGVWRWWDEAKLDCCIDLDDVKKVGITLDEFACLAKCQGLRVTARRPSESASCAQFRDDVRKAISSGGTSIIDVSYDRSALGQAGSGHFSPLGAYHESTDSVLVLDVARFKYPPHWVGVERMYDAMLRCDKSTEKPRGWVMLSAIPATPRLVALRSPRHCACLRQLFGGTFVEEVKRAPSEQAAAELLFRRCTCCSLNEMASILTPRTYHSFKMERTDQPELLKKLRACSARKVVETFVDRDAACVDRLALLLLAVWGGSVDDERLAEEVGIIKLQMAALVSCDAQTRSRSRSPCCSKSNNK